MNSRAIWKFFTSLKLTVACLAFGVVLVFLGTLAQVDEGLYQAQARWFKSFIVMWGPQGAHWSMPVFPGGYTLGILLVVNLLAAHLKRFTWGWKKVGIHLTHFGVVLLLVGQLATDMLSRESLLTLHVGQSRSYTEDASKAELSFLLDAGNGQDRVVSIDQRRLAKGGDIQDPNLPFTVRIQAYHPNSDVFSRKSAIEAGGKLTTAFATMEAEYATPEGLPAQAERAMQAGGRMNVWAEALKAIGEPSGPDLSAIAKRVAADPVKGPKLCTELKTRFRTQMAKRFTMQGGSMKFAAEMLANNQPVTEETVPSATPTGPGKSIVLVPLPEGKGMDDRNLPAMIIEIPGKNLPPLLLSPLLEPQDLPLDGKGYRVGLRFERYYHPFTITMLKTTHDVYRGTDIPKDYRSRIRVDNNETNEHREVDIYMNNPLRYSGLTFYQYQMSKMQEADSSETSTLQVVRNPSWLTPYFGCALVALGMIYQFLFHLNGFINRRKPLPPPPKASKKTPERAQADVAV